MTDPTTLLSEEVKFAWVVFDDEGEAVVVAPSDEDWVEVFAELDEWSLTDLNKPEMAF